MIRYVVDKRTRIGLREYHKYCNIGRKSTNDWNSTRSVICLPALLREHCIYNIEVKIKAFLWTRVERGRNFCRIQDSKWALLDKLLSSGVCSSGCALKNVYCWETVVVLRVGRWCLIAFWFGRSWRYLPPPLYEKVFTRIVAIITLVLAPCWYIP